MSVFVLKLTMMTSWRRFDVSPGDGWGKVEEVDEAVENSVAEVC